MRSLRMFVGVALVAAGLALSACGGGLAGLGTSTPAEATSVAAAEQAFTTAAHLEVLWLQSGKATPAQAKLAKAFRQAAYDDIVAGREAVANNDSAAIAVSLKLFKQALPAFTGYIAANGGAVDAGK